MFALLSFTPLQPTPGLALWSVIIFLLFWFLMYKYAFKPITASLKAREVGIQDSLDEAKKAREEMQNLKAENEKILEQAREERMAILNEAKEIKNKTINEAKGKAEDEAKRIVENARVEIENQKKAAMIEVKNKVGTMAIDIAEKILKKELNANQEQVSFVNRLVDDIKLN